MFGARFDDIINGESFVLTSPKRELVAMSVDEVPGVVEAAGEAAAAGMWVAGYLTYEAAAGFDSAFVVQEPESDIVAWFGVFEGRQDVAPAVHDPTEAGSYAISQWRSTVDRARYDDSFEKVQRHILEGDTYQVNFTFPLHAAFTGDLDVFYNDLVCAQRPRYAAHLWHGDLHVLSVSPERFFAVSGRRIETQPMKGTAPRGRTMDEDLGRRDTLVGSEKDVAENLMIVDLIRNDIGKVAEVGTVRTTDLFDVERYRTVWQMTSTVEAELRPDVSLVDVFEALFPCGSITGAPKAKSMEIIADVEYSPRGVYCGTVGFIPPGDGLDGASFNVAIRTVEIDDAEGLACYGVGGAVTWDSTADREFAEAVTKFEVLRFDISPMDLVEAIRWDDGWLWLDRHLDRLTTSASYWSFNVDRAAVAAALDDVAAGLESPSKVRVQCSAGGTISITVSDAPKRWAEGPGPAVEPVLIVLDTDPVDDANPRLFHKTTDRRQFTARASRHPDADDVLLVNKAGHVTETTIANVVFLIDGTWVTPPILDGLLPGVMRGVLVESGVVTERSVTIPEALTADAVALVSAVRGWRPAVIG